MRRIPNCLLPPRWPRLDEAGVALGLICAWYALHRVMISNDEVASGVAQASGRLVGVGSVDLTRPMAAVREIRRCVRELGFKGDPHAALAVGGAADRPALLSDLRRLLRGGRAVLHPDRPHGPLDAPSGGRATDLPRSGGDRLPGADHRRRPHRLPWTDEAIAVATKHERVTSTRRPTPRAAIRRRWVEFMRGHGRARVLFGSNWPMIAPARPRRARRARARRRGADALPVGERRRVYQLAPGWGDYFFGVGSTAIATGLA